jgi:5,10-methylenetetrahydromethanopterin reductase
VAGRDPGELAFGAYVNVACHPDLELARRLVSGGLASFSRFSAMHGVPTGPLTGGADEVVRRIRDNYDMKAHGEPGSSQTAVLTDEFIDRFAVVGGPERFVQRVEEIVNLGFDRIVMTIPNQAARERYPDETAEAHRYLVDEVLPRLPRR